jgi:uncharacterized protein (TIGR01777 family)
MERERADSTRKLDVAITGSSGLIGTALSKALRAAGHRAIPVDRSVPMDFAGVDAVVNLAGAGIGDKRWNEARKRELVSSRVETTRRVVAAVDRDDVPVLLSGSAIGYYGSRGDEVLTESSGPGGGFLSDLCVEWEGVAMEAAPSARVVLLRTGITLSPEGGALKKLLPLFRLGVGGRMGSGSQWVSWITVDDHVRATMHLLSSSVSGPVNLTAPHPVTNAEQAKTLGRVLGRPSVLPTPSFGPKLLLGSELADALLNDSQRVVPEVLLGDGFTFSHPTLEGALRALLTK